jgi:DNA-binding transcriptional MerR regulator
MRITELAKRAGTTTDRVRYLERKGYVESRRLKLKERAVRDYSDAAVRLVELISGFLEEGFTYEAAHRKAIEELDKPRLL